MNVPKWLVEPHNPDTQAAMLLHEIIVRDWSLPLVGDHRGCVVAYVAGAYWDDPDARAVAQANAELIAAAPALKAENERLKDLLARIAELAAVGLGDWGAAAPSYVPQDLIGFAFIRDAVADAVKEQS